MTIERTQTHETRWRGEMTSEDVHDVMLCALRSLTGAPHSGLRLDLTIDGQPVALPGVTFELVHDELWYRKGDT